MASEDDEDKPLDWRDVNTCQRCGESVSVILIYAGQRVCSRCWRGDVPKKKEEDRAEEGPSE